MKKFLTKVGLNLAFSLLIVNAVAWLSLYSLRHSSFYKPNFLENAVPEESFDYIVLGSSTGLTTLDTKQIDSITGLRGINLSIDDTSMNSHFLMLEHFIALGKKTRICVLTFSADDMSRDDPGLSSNDYRFLSLINRNYVSAYFAALEDGWVRPLSLSQYQPFIGVGYYNAEIFFPSIFAALQPDKRNRFDSRGNFSYPESGMTDERPMKTIELEAKNPYFMRIKTLCERNGIRLMLYHPPIYNRRIESGPSMPDFVDHSSLVGDKAYFYDFLHVDSKGRKRASEAFAPKIKALADSLPGE